MKMTLLLSTFLIIFATGCSTKHTKIKLENGQDAIEIACSKKSKCQKRASEVCGGKESYKTLTEITESPKDSKKKRKYFSIVQCFANGGSAPDKIIMKNGDVYRGKILILEVNEYVQLLLANGNEKRISFKEIKSIKKDSITMAKDEAPEEVDEDFKIKGEKKNKEEKRKK